MRRGLFEPNAAYEVMCYCSAFCATDLCDVVNALDMFYSIIFFKSFQQFVNYSVLKPQQTSILWNECCSEKYKISPLKKKFRLKSTNDFLFICWYKCRKKWLPFYLLIYMQKKTQFRRKNAGQLHFMKWDQISNLPLRIGTSKIRHQLHVIQSARTTRSVGDMHLMPRLRPVIYL